LLRALPKSLRVNFVPAPDVARAVLARVTPDDGPLLDVLGRELLRTTGVPVPRDAWGLTRVPAHLRMTFRVEDERGRPLAVGKDLAALTAGVGPKLRAAVSEAASGIERRGLRDWTFDTLPHTVEQRRAGHVVRGYPALVDEADAVAVRVLPSEAEQKQAMWLGTRRLLLLTVPSPVRSMQGLPNQTRLALGHNPHGSVAALLEDCLTAALDSLMSDYGAPVWTAEGFAGLRDKVRSELDDVILDVVTTVARILPAAYDVTRRLDGLTSPVLAASVADVRAQLGALVFPNFVTATGAARSPDLVRYLQGIERRLDKLPDDPRRDAERRAVVADLQVSYRELLDRLPPARRAEDDVRRIRWMLEELRVSLFAQPLRTAYPVSEKRVRRAIDDIER
jgi:ATP-dependent helicase HrpA